jgi:tetratricopeptide (TPR) repeat protein
MQVKAYKKAVELEPRHCEAYFNMGVLYHSHGRLDLSIPAYEKAIEIDPMHFDAISNLGSARHKKGDLEGAVEMYLKAIEMLEAAGNGNVDTLPSPSSLLISSQTRLLII